MKRKSLEFNQIEYVNQFVDPSVDEAVRAFHLSTLSPACSPLENLVALAPVDATELANVEFYSARFSHLSRICEPALPSLTKVSRPISLKKGTKGRKISLMQLFAGITNIFGADATLRRHYPSGAHYIV